MDGLIALAYAKKLYNLAEGPQGPPGEVSEAELTAALATKANTDGYYENLGSGTADNLVTDVKANDQSPYLFRTSGGSVDIGDREYVNGIVGGTVAWNQLTTMEGSFTCPANVITNKYWTDGTNVKINYIAGHKYLVTYTQETTMTSCTRNTLGCNDGVEHWQSSSPNRNLEKGDYYWIFVPSTSTQNGTVQIWCHTPDISVTYSDCQVFDLTQMFGSTIADYIYSIEQANAGAGVAWFKKLFPKPYYAYDAGSLKSVGNLVSHDTVGFNLLEDDVISGTYTGYSNMLSAEATASLKKLFKKFQKLGASIYYHVDRSATATEGVSVGSIRCFIGGTSVFPLTPGFVYNWAEAQGVDIDSITSIYVYGTSPASTVTLSNPCFNLHWDGSRDGEYEPYVKHSYPLDSGLTLRGIPKLDASNNLYYDGDVYEPDGTVTRKWANGNITTASKFEDETGYFWHTTTTDLGLPAIKGLNAGLSADRLVVTSGISQTTDEGTIVIYANGIIRWKEKGTMSQADYRTYLASNPIEIVYELETPTTDTADPYQATQLVDDFGTEEFVLSSGAFPMPVGHNTDYPVNLKAKLEMAPNSPDGDGDYIVRQTGGENSYVKLVIEDALPTMPTTAGNYVLTVTIAEGQDPVLDWVAQA